MLGMGALVSCEDDTGTAIGTPYNPSQPVKLTSFEPDSGGMATKLFIDGANFGNDPTAVKVYFNKTRANVVGSDGEHLYVITPRQPGDTCVISVVVGKDSTIFDKTFRYKTMITVQTIAGVKGDYNYTMGDLTSTRLDQPSTLCLDAEGNIFVSHWRVPYSFIVINVAKGISQELFTGEALGAPSADAEGKVVMAGTDSGDGYLQFDPESQWAARRRTILHPTVEEDPTNQKAFTINYKHGITSCKIDGYMYTRSYNGMVVRFDPKTRKGEFVKLNPSGDSGTGRVTDAGYLNPDADSFPYFDPNHPNIMLVAFPGHHCIISVDIETRDASLYAGTYKTSGYQDGDRLEAKFNAPCQICSDSNGSIFIGDTNNYCIRKIDSDGKVSTAIGKGTISGYQDGNAEDALFMGPKGVAIDKDNNIYVADFGTNGSSGHAGSNCIRVLSIQ
ncbi:MAG: IPT/TIG domain-containing protein [Bacteroidales bacterium]|nr:IPT/TIG domain-containing protein [Bacteroidales bacterium]